MFRRFIRRGRESMPALPPSQIDRLIAKGLQVGSDFNMLSGVVIDPDHCWHISIGNSVTLAPRVHIVAHDASTKMFLGYTRIGKVAIGNQVFIGAGTIILPGVTIGSRVVVGAGSVVTHDIPSDSVAAGNPAVVKCTLQDFLTKRRREMEMAPWFGEEYTLRRNLSDEKKEQMNKDMVNRIGYVD
jgi:maltose O-acetyltransferase